MNQKKSPPLFLLKKQLNYQRLIYPVVGLIVFGAIFFSAWIARHADEQMRAELLIQINLIVQAIDEDDLRMLSGTETDLELSEYISLKAKLARFLQANNDYQFVYLMGMEADDSIIFLVDSEPDSSEDYSPPGELYEEASDRLIALFDDGIPFVEGPLVDQWGVWVSALAPLKDPDTGKVLAVVGMDIDAASWHKEVAKRVIVPLGLIISLLIVAGAALVVIKSQKKLHESELKYQLSFKNSPDAYLIMSDKVFVECNPAAEKMFGAKRNEIIGKSPQFFSPRLQPNGSSSSATAASHIEEALRKGDQTFEWLHQRVNGETFWVEVSLNALNVEGKKYIFAACRDITERKKAESELIFISYHDKLTGLYNRSYLEDRLKDFSSEDYYPLSVVMADLNGLKLVNDTYGHSVGDEMLKIAADIMKEGCREDDVIARWGGDEFLVLMPRCDGLRAGSITKKITELFRKTVIRDIPLSISIGLVTVEYPSEDIADLIKEAENSMYKQKLTESKSTKSAVLGALLKTLAAKSYETETHTRNMTSMAIKIGEKFGLPESELKRLELLITLHDIGKMNVPEEILVKDKPLTEEEWAVIKKHPETGYRIAMATEEFAHVAEDILSHHERWDGSGYPRGLKGEGIPLLARITAVADACEVMMNGRPYKKAMTLQEIKHELSVSSGYHFDPELVKITLQLLEREQDAFIEKN